MLQREEMTDVRSIESKVSSTTDTSVDALIETSIGGLENSLGMNTIEYSQVMSERSEQEDFEWAAAKIFLIQQILQNLPDRQRVADIGCRTGFVAAYYQTATGVTEMHGFEIAEAPLTVARQRGIIPHIWISGVSPCPVEDNFFDAVIAGDVIEHLLNTDIFLQELHRVIRPGGHLIITTPNLAWWWNRLRLLWGKVPANMGSVSPQFAADKAVDRKHLRVSVNREWLHLFQQFGFECVAVKGYYYPPLLRPGVRLLDRQFTKFPALAHSNLFLLRKSIPS